MNRNPPNSNKPVVRPASRPGDRNDSRRAAGPGARPAPRPGDAPGKRPDARPGFARPAVPPASGVATSEAAADGIRLSKVMAERGLASRREADEWIEAGWVKVDGVAAVLGLRVKPEAVIEIDPLARSQQALRVTVLLHKPIGYVSGQAEDGHQPASVLFVGSNRWADDKTPIRFHPGQQRGLAPAGRLDIDSTGLLVLTQDGRIAKQLIGEDSLVEKEYLVRVRHLNPGPLPPEKMSLLQHGLSLDGRQLKPARVSWANEDQLRFVLREGRKRQIRRMCDMVGLEVLGLKRVRIGSVVLGKLPPGQWRYLRPDERF
jgi:23S rRNA pseudouridine2604 synthase